MLDKRQRVPHNTGMTTTENTESYWIVIHVDGVQHVAFEHGNHDEAEVAQRLQEARWDYPLSEVCTHLLLTSHLDPDMFD